MDSAPPNSAGIRDYVGIIRRRFVYVAAIAPTTFLFFVFMAFWLRPQFRATATILLQSSSVTKDVIETTIASEPEQQIEVAQEKVLSADTLSSLVRDYDPYPDDRNSSVRQKAQRALSATSVEKVDPITFKPTSDESNAFSLHYRNPNRQRAAAVASRIAELFLSYSQRQRTQEASETAGFLRQQSAGVTQQIAGVDGELAQLKIREGDALPELRAQNQEALDRSQHELDTLQQEILGAEDKESLLAVRLSQISPNLMTQSGDLTDLATVRAELTEAEQRYTPEHPEVIRLKHALQVLMAQKQAISATGVVAGANNPQYVTTATELQSARRELASLRAEATREQTQIDHYEELLRRTPAVERTESEILRRRESLQNQYQQLQDRLQSAQEAASFEAQQRGARFVMVQAPSVPGPPYSPNRPGLIALGLLLSMVFAATAVVLAENTDSSVRNVADLPLLADAPLLATIPVIRNRDDYIRRRLLIAGFAAAYVVGTSLVGAVVLAAHHRH